MVFLRKKLEDKYFVLHDFLSLSASQSFILSPQTEISDDSVGGRRALECRNKIFNVVRRCYHMQVFKENASWRGRLWY